MKRAFSLQFISSVIVDIFYLFLFLIFFTSFSYAEFKDFIADKEEIYYKLYEDDKVIYFTEKISITTINNQPVHQLKVTGSDGGYAEYYFKKGSLNPLMITYYNNKGQVIKDIRYGKDSINVFISDKNINYTYDLQNREVYDMSSFFHLFRGFPWEKKEEIILVFVPDIKRTVAMYVKQIGQENIKIENDNYECYVLELGLAGIIESSLFPQTYKFWITKKEPHIFIKYTGKLPTGVKQVTEVLKYKSF